MIPVSRRTIASAIRRWRSLGSESKSSPASSRSAAPARAPSASRVTSSGSSAVDVVQAVGRLVAEQQQHRAGERPGARPAPGRRAAGTRRRRSGAARSQAHRAPGPGDEVGHEHRDPDRQVDRLHRRIKAARLDSARPDRRGSARLMASANTRSASTCSASAPGERDWARCCARPPRPVAGARRDRGRRLRADADLGHQRCRGSTSTTPPTTSRASSSPPRRKCVPGSQADALAQASMVPGWTIERRPTATIRGGFTGRRSRTPAAAATTSRSRAHRRLRAEAKSAKLEIVDLEGV